MGEQNDIETYNYSRFNEGSDFLAFRTALPVGSNAPDFAGTLLGAGRPARLSDFWRDQDVLIEFGSLT
jgi:hypothetical protein